MLRNGNYDSYEIPVSLCLCLIRKMNNFSNATKGQWHKETYDYVGDSRFFVLTTNAFTWDDWLKDKNWNASLLSQPKTDTSNVYF